MISSFEDLLAPLTIDEFRKALRERTLIFRRGAGDNRLAGLLDWETLRNLVEDDSFPGPQVRITRNSRALHGVMYLDGKKMNAEKFAKLMHGGASLITQPIDPCVPALHALCESARDHVSDFVWAGAVAQTGGGGALTIHYDTQDLIILQLAGRKRWRIFSPTVDFPLREFRSHGEPSDNLVLDEVLAPGDFLFLPAGFWHVCENGPDLSLHGIIFFQAATGLQALGSLTHKLKDDLAFRRPLRRFESTEERVAHEKFLKAQLIRKIEDASFDELLADFVPNKDY